MPLIGTGIDVRMCICCNITLCYMVADSNARIFVFREGSRSLTPARGERSASADWFFIAKTNFVSVVRTEFLNAIYVNLSI
jgi:hypothetical protein